MKKQILVPLDGSQLAEMILPHAAAYARANACTLDLLHVVSPPTAINSSAWSMAPSVEIWREWENEVESGKHYIEVIADRVRKLGIEARTFVMEADPAICIVSFALDHPEVVLVAMSTHGRSGIKRLVLGSVAEQVLHSSPVPLLVLHPSHEKDILNNIQVPEYSSILVPLDGSEFAVQALLQAKTLAHKLDASLTLVSAVADGPLGIELNNIIDVPDEWTPEMEAQADYLKDIVQELKDEQIPVQAVLEYGPPAEGILRVVDNTNTDLIVMSTHGRSGLSRFWLGSIAMKVVRNARCPVLMVRALERVKDPEHQMAAINVVPIALP